MAQLWSTGPALIYVALTGTGDAPGGGLGGPPVNPAFLGTAEFAPAIHVRREWESVFNDFGGGRVPFDTMYESKEGFTFADLTRWDENVYQQLAAAPRTAEGGFDPTNPQDGADFVGDIGSLMITEGLAYSVFIKFPFASKSAYAGMKPGYRFPASYLMGPDEANSLGTKPFKRHIVFHHLRTFEPSTQIFRLYDSAFMDQLPAIT